MKTRSGKKEMLDIEDLAKLKHCHRETLRLLVRKGLLKPVDPSPPFYFRREVIEALPDFRVGRPKGSTKKSIEGR